MQLGLARMLEVELRPGEDELMVELPDKSLTETIPLGDDPPAYLGVSVEEDGKGMRLRSGPAPLGYV